MKLQCNSYTLWAILFLFFLSTNSIAQTIWSEDFESYIDDSGYKGTLTSGDYPSSVTKWSLEVVNNLWTASSWYMVNTVSSNNLFETIKPSSECVWTSEIISISDFVDVVLQVSISEVGTLESSDYIKLYYKLDGGTETLFNVNGDNTDDFNSLTAIQSGLSGATIQIIIKTKNNSFSEKIRFDDLTVKGVLGNSSLVFTEISDPSDEPNARFVEIKNTSSTTIDFSVNTYYLSCQLDGTIWSEFQLSGTLCSGCVRTYAKSSSEFDSSYGYMPDYVNSIIDGDGDDAYLIYSGGNHSVGTIVDVYGVIDQDGTEQNWEYTDERAVRNSSVTSGVSSWDDSEWIISAASTISMTPDALEQEFRFFNSVWHPNSLAPSITSDSEVVTIQSGIATIGESFDCASLNVFSSSTLELSAGKGITVSGAVTNKGSIKLKSDSTSNSSLITTGISTGDIQYDLYVTGGVSSPWHLISSPIHSQSISDFVSETNNSIQTSASNNYGLAQYNPSTDAWNYYHNGSGVYPNIAADSAGNFTVAKAYSILRSSNGEVTFTGSLNSGNQVISLEADNWNLIGNPYSSFVNVNSLADASHNIISSSSNALNDSYEAIYLWNSVSTTYDIINHASSAAFLSPGQGLFVYADSDGGDFTFTPEMQSHQSGEWFQQLIAPTSLKLLLDFNTVNSSTDIKYIDNTTLGFDVGYDAGRFDAGNNDYYVYSQLPESLLDSLELGLQCIPEFLLFESVTIPIGVSVVENTPISFSIDLLNFPENINVYIEDVLLHTQTRIDNAGSVYETIMNVDEPSVGRFFLKIQSPDFSSSEIQSDDYLIFLNNIKSVLYVQGEVSKLTELRIYDALGRLILEVELESSTNIQLSLPKLSTGVYIIQLAMKNTRIIKKIII